MTKKRSSEISADENQEIFSGKGKIVKIFIRVWKCFENRGEIWNRGEMHHGLRGDGRPWHSLLGFWQMFLETCFIITHWIKSLALNYTKPIVLLLKLYWQPFADTKHLALFYHIWKGLNVWNSSTLIYPSITSLANPQENYVII